MYWFFIIWWYYDYEILIDDCVIIMKIVYMDWWIIKYIVNMNVIIKWNVCYVMNMMNDKRLVW